MLNKVTLIGNLGKDPEIRSMQSGDEMAQISVATSESWKDKQTGEKRERTEWHRVVVFNKGLVSLAKNYLKKGSKVYIEGQLETRKWSDKDGTDRYTTEIVLRPFHGEIKILSFKENNSDAQTYDHSNEAVKNQNTFDDEIPF